MRTMGEGWCCGPSRLLLRFLAVLPVPPFACVWSSHSCMMSLTLSVSVLEVLVVVPVCICLLSVP